MSGSISTWIKQLAEGDSSAATPLKNRFWKRLTVKAKRMIRKTGLVTFDYEDVRQRVFGDLMMEIMSGQARQVVNRRLFWRMLEKMTHAQAIDLKRKELAKKRQVGKQLQLKEVANDPHRTQVLSMFEEELERVSKVVDQDAKKIIDRLRQGFGIDEIAAEFEVSPRTIHRKLAAIKDAVHDGKRN